MPTDTISEQQPAIRTLRRSGDGYKEIVHQVIPIAFQGDLEALKGDGQDV